MRGRSFRHRRARGGRRSRRGSPRSYARSQARGVGAVDQYLRIATEVEALAGEEALARPFAIQAIVEAGGSRMPFNQQTLAEYSPNMLTSANSSLGENSITIMLYDPRATNPAPSSWVCAP